jgi:caa(3)-type oxidase subunit IV
MFKSFFTKINTQSPENYTSGGNKHDEHQLLPVSLYLKIFFALLAMIFINIGISKLPIPGLYITGLLIFVALVQTVLVAMFFMELIHEDKFYTFVFASSILFMLLFFVISLAELNGRDFFHKVEGIKYLREVEQNGNFAPHGPKSNQNK